MLFADDVNGLWPEAATMRALQLLLDTPCVEIALPA
jgi:hypothetical protein